MRKMTGFLVNPFWQTMAFKPVAFKPVAGTIALCVLSCLSFAPAAWAARPVFNQTPATLQRYFGRPIARNTLPLGSDRTSVTYSYSAGRLRRVFPEAKDLRIKATFINNRLQEVGIASGNALIQRYPQRVDQVYTFIFNSPPPRQHPRYGQSLTDDSGLTGSLQSQAFCLGNGIATNFEWHSVQEATLLGNFFLDRRC